MKEVPAMLQAMTITAAQFAPVAGSGPVLCMVNLVLDGRCYIEGAQLVRRPGGLSLCFPMYREDLPCRWVHTPLAEQPLPVVPLPLYHKLATMAHEAPTVLY